MARKLKETVTRLEKTDEVKRLRASGFYLNCALSVLAPESLQVDQWIFTYYNPRENRVVEIIAGDELEFKQPAEPVRPTQHELVISSVKTSEAKVLEKAQKEFRKFKEPLSQIILSLQTDVSRPVWAVNFVTKTLFIVTVRLDGVTGDVTGSEKNALTMVRQGGPGNGQA